MGWCPLKEPRSPGGAPAEPEPRMQAARCRVYVAQCWSPAKPLNDFLGSSFRNSLCGFLHKMHHWPWFPLQGRSSFVTGPSVCPFVFPVEFGAFFTWPGCQSLVRSAVCQASPHLRLSFSPSFGHRADALTFANIKFISLPFREQAFGVKPKNPCPAPDITDIPRSF